MTITANAPVTTRDILALLAFLGPETVGLRALPIPLAAAATSAENLGLVAIRFDRVAVTTAGARALDKASEALAAVMVFAA